MSVGVKETAELIEIKKKTRELEGRLESFVRLLTKKNKIDFERCDDYGQRCFNLVVVFDEINIEALTSNIINEVRKVYKEFIKLRKKIRPIERRYNENLSVKKAIKEDIRKSMI